MKRFFTFSLLALLSAFSSLPAAEKVSFEEQVMPVLRNNCLKCHNPDKAKGDLDLTTYSGAMKGGGSGPSVNSGDPDGSKLFKVIVRTEDPAMPPNSPKISDKEIDVIKRWIEGGLLETSTSKAVASRKPKMDLTIGSVSVGKPDGPPPMPQDLLLEPVVRPERTTALNAIAGSPWAPVIALGVPKQILLYNSDTLELAGVLPFPEGHPYDLKFSRNGKLLLAGGGHDARSGSVVLWDVTTGERITTVGNEFDAVLAADISADQQWIALGGPPRLIKIFSTKTGELEHQIKKHTDWVTALEFSPDGKLLATGDRSGNLYVWEADSGEEVATLKGHKGAITSISWRDDSQIVLSSSEDGSIKLWKAKDGDVVRSLNGHNGGTLWARYTHDGRIVSCGRDNQLAVWNADGSRKTSAPSPKDLPVRVAFTHDGGRFVGVDWLGNVSVWNSADGKLAGELSSNPQTIAERRDSVSKELARLESLQPAKEAAITAAETEFAQLEAQKTDARRLALLKEKVAVVKAELDAHLAQIKRLRTQLAGFKAAEFNVTVYQAKDQLAAKQRELEKFQGTVADGDDGIAQAKKNLETARKAQTDLATKLSDLDKTQRASRRLVADAGNALKTISKAVTKLEARVEREKTTTVSPAELKQSQDELAAAKAAQTEKQAALDKLNTELTQTRDAQAKAQKEQSEFPKRLKSLADKIKQQETELAEAKSGVERLTKEVAAEKTRVEGLVAEYKKLKESAAAENRQAKL